MKYTLLFCLVFASSISATAQTASPTPLLYSDKTIVGMRSIQQAALQSNYAYNQAGYLSNNIGPRLSGSLLDPSNTSLRKCENSGSK